MQQILQETVAHCVHLLLVSVSVCFIMHAEMGLAGKTIETQEQTESEHQPRLSSLGALHSI